jgi:hypothetical protein
MDVTVAGVRAVSGRRLTARNYGPVDLHGHQIQFAVSNAFFRHD